MAFYRWQKGGSNWSKLFWVGNDLRVIGPEVLVGMVAARVSKALKN